MEDLNTDRTRKECIRNELGDRKIQKSTGSKIISNYKFEGSPSANIELHEIAAQVSVPVDGGWGWVVLIAAFFIIFVVDGLCFTYGTLLKDVADDMQVSISSAASVGSLQFTLYLMLSPIASAFINRFGFRTCGMTGGIIICYSALTSTFSRDFSSFFVVYGVFYGIGCCFSSMAAYLVVGFYFTKHRRTALVIVTVGSSCGAMVFYPLNFFFVDLAGWRTTVLLHSGLLGLVFFFSLSFRPLASLVVKKTDEVDNPTRTMIYLPSVIGASPGSRRVSDARPGQGATVTERTFGAVSNVRFPTTADVVRDEPDLTLVGTSKPPPPSKIILATTHPVSQAQLKHVKSLVTKGVVSDIDTKIHITEHRQKKKWTCCGRLCEWESHTKDARPLYRDDVFYEGKIKNLPQYHKSVTQKAAAKVNSAGEASDAIGIEYHMAVTRTMTLRDLKEKKGVLTTAVKRVLATMCNVALLKRRSFLMQCAAGFCNLSGSLIPFVFMQSRSTQAGIDPNQSKFFVSVIGGFGVIGRLVWSVMAMKCCPSYLYGLGLFLAGLSCVLSCLSYDVFYQFVYSAVYGFCICVTNALRSLLLVDLYGLEQLTNSTGMLLLFMGIGTLFGAPVAGTLGQRYGYDMAFYYAGTLLMLAGFFAIPVKKLATKENIVLQLSEKKALEAREKETPVVSKQIIHEVDQPPNSTNRLTVTSSILENASNRPPYERKKPPERPLFIRTPSNDSRDLR